MLERIVTPASRALLLILLSCPAMFAAEIATAAEDAEPVVSITWLTADPPAGNDNKPNAGITDRLLTFMRAQWPQVEHTVLVANVKRSWQMTTRGEHACHVSALRTPEREKLAYFSNTQLVPPMQLIARRDKLDALPRDPAGEVELTRLLEDRSLRGALVESRSYGDYVDGLLARRGENQALVFYPAGDYGSQVLPMLAVGRADYTVEYDAVLVMSREREKLLTTQLTSVPIQGASQPLPVGVACPRSPWGLAAIRGVDAVLGTPAGAAMLRESLERWITPEVRLVYGTRIDAFYKERAKPSVIR